jgi:hypothetical protein
LREERLVQVQRGAQAAKLVSCRLVPEHKTSGIAGQKAKCKEYE